MNTIKMTAGFSWLYGHAKDGKLPEHLTEDDRAVIVRYLSAVIEHLPEVKTEANESEDQVIEKLVVLTHATIRGEYT